MATDAVAFIRALGLSKTDLLGFSLGGFIAQVIAQKHPDLVRRMILAGTSAPAAKGSATWLPVAERRGQGNSREEASEAVALFHTVSRRPEGGCGILQRLGTRTTRPRFACNTRDHRCSGDRDYQVGMAPKPTSLGGIQHQVLVANGDTDVMVPSINSVELARKLPHSQLSIFLILDMELSSSITARSRPDRPISAELTLIRHCRFTGNGCGPPDGHQGARSRVWRHERGARGGVPASDDTVVQWSSSRRGAGRASLLSVALGMQIPDQPASCEVGVHVLKLG